MGDEPLSTLGPQILVVDDEPDICELISYEAKKRGAQVDLATNGEEALSKVKEKNYDVVISDIEMPRVNGVEFLKQIQIHRNDAKQPAVIFTSALSPVTPEDALKLGADAYFTKPFKLTDLVRRALDLVNLPAKLGSRQYERFETDLKEKIRFSSDSDEQYASLLNISIGGMFFTWPEPLPEPGMEFEFKLIAKANELLVIEGKGVIQWVKPQSPDGQFPSGCGARFTELNSRSKRDILRLINSLKTKTIDDRL